MPVTSCRQPLRQSLLGSTQPQTVEQDEGCIEVRDKARWAEDSGHKLAGEAAKEEQNKMEEGQLLAHRLEV